VIHSGDLAANEPVVPAVFLSEFLLMIKVKCGHCQRIITAPDQAAGKKGKCPGCQALITIPAPDPEVFTDIELVEEEPEIVEAVEAVEEIEAAPPPKKVVRPTAPVRAVQPPAKPRRIVAQLAEDDEDDVAEAAEVVEADESEDDRPRRRKKAGRTRWRGEWADCPSCGAPGDATRLHYTLWGGFIGPMIICHVRCNQCGAAYNGNKGDYNTARIAIFFGVNLAISLVVIAFVILVAAVSNR
jgi:hypothetical protein